MSIFDEVEDLSPQEIEMTNKEHRAFLRRLKEDLATAAVSLDRREARYMVDLYYQIQEFRKRTKNQTRAAGEGREPNTLVKWLGNEFNALELRIKSAMEAYAHDGPMPITGRWVLGLHGFGPVFAGALLAFIDLDRAPTAGSLWRYAGYDPSVEWLGGERAREIVKEICGARGKITPDQIDELAAFTGMRVEQIVKWATTTPKQETRPLNRTNIAKAISRRPWNARFKTLCWKISDCIVKFSGSKKSYYGPLYREYKAKLIRRNETGEFAEAAAESLTRLKDKSTDTYKANSEGKLSKGHLEARAKRWASKLFLSHWHEVAYQEYFDKPAPKPYVLAHMDHVHRIEVPDWPFQTEKEIKAEQERCTKVGTTMKGIRRKKRAGKKKKS